MRFCCNLPSHPHIYEKVFYKKMACSKPKKQNFSISEEGGGREFQDLQRGLDFLFLETIDESIEQFSMRFVQFS